MKRLLVLSVLVASTTIGAAEDRQPTAGDVTRLLQQLRAGDVDARKDAAESLTDLLISRHVVSVCDSTDIIANSLSDSSSEVRVGAGGILAVCAATNPGLAGRVLRHQPEIVKNLSSPEAAEREMMLNLLSFLGVTLPTQLESPVLERLNDPARKVRKAAIYVLLRFKPFPAQAIPSLDLLIEQGDEERGYAEIILGVVKASDSRTIQALMSGLKDKDRFVQQEALRALGRIGHPASGTIPDIHALENNPDTDPILRDLAKEAIRAIQ
jgi:HEAT repeat protein